jgi:hypothetical protein
MSNIFTHAMLFIAPLAAAAPLGCDSPKSTSAGPASSASSTAAAPSGVASGGASAAASSPRAPAGPPLVDLLQTTESEVAVSSNVDNPKDFPEHLVDGKPETAWNGKTGDLHGWISFRVPDDAHVSKILITPGFDKKNAEGDLFTMNHRIKKIRVTRNGEAVGAQALDIERRTLQAMNVDKPGGTYRIEVLDTEPGSKKTWKELTVSELRVLGTAGKTGIRKSPRLPDVRVGALGGVHVDAQNRTVASLSLGFAKPEEFCKAFRNHYEPINQKRTDYPGPVETTCAATDDSAASIKNAAPVAPFVDALTYGATDDESNFSAVAFHMQKAWFFVGPHLADDGVGDPHCGGYGEYLGDAKVTFAQTSRGAMALVTWHYGYEVHGPRVDEKTGDISGTFSNSTVTFYAEACVGTDTLVTCDKPITIDTHFADDEQLTNARSWRSTKKASLKPDGTVAISP